MTVGTIRNGAAATVIITRLACDVLIDAKLIRHFTLDCTRRFQPLSDSPGEPSGNARDITPPLWRSVAHRTNRSISRS